MSLNWDARECGEAWEELPPEKREAVIFGCMATDIGRITEANYREWYTRYVMMYRAGGLGEDRYLTLTDVKASIGLSTNVSTTTTAAFKKRVYDRLRYSAEDLVGSLERETTDFGPANGGRTDG